LGSQVSSSVAGTVLADRYVLSRLLGEGAAGAVWLARDTRLEIEVAVKILRAHLVSHAGVRERFAREAALSERMLSPHVVKVLGGGLADDVPYIVYERLEGEDLAARLVRERTLTLGEARSVVIHLCRALARAHAVGALHRDVKPENLFLTVDPDGRLLAKVLDFGVAELVRSREDDRDQLVGTLEYMAPEVLLGERPPSVQSDLYAVGVVAYECCTGKKPRAAANVGELVLAFATGSVVPASERRPEVSPELDAWFARALHRDPDARFPSAKAMAEELHVAMKTANVTSDPKLPTGTMRPRATSFVFEDERRPTASYSIIRPSMPVPERPSRRPEESHGTSSRRSLGAAASPAEARLSVPPLRPLPRITHAPPAEAESTHVVRRRDPRTDES